MPTCLSSKLRGVVDMRKDWVQDMRTDGSIEIRWVSEQKQKADILTKGLPTYQFKTGLNLTRGKSHHIDNREVVNLVYSELVQQHSLGLDG